MARSICLSLLVLLLSSTNLFAGKQSPATLGDLIAAGLEKNLGLTIVRHDIAVSQEAITIADAAFDPQLSASTGFSRSRTPYEASVTSATASDSEDYQARVALERTLKTGLTASVALDSTWSSDNDLTNNLDPSYRSALILELNQPLLRNFGTDVNTTATQQARIATKQAELSWLYQAQGLALEMESLIRRIAGAARIVQLRRDAETLAGELYRANQLRYEAGLIPVTELQEAETALANRQLNLSLALQSRDLLVEQLNRQFSLALPAGFDPLSLLAAEPDVTTVYNDLDALFEKAVDKRLDLKINRYATDAGQREKLYRENQLKPQLDLQLQAGLNGLSGHDRGIVGGSAFERNWPDSFGSLASADGFQWSAGLVYSIPLGQRAAKARVRQAELDISRSRYRQQDLEVQLKDELRQQQINISRSGEQLELARRFAELAQTSLNQEQRRLEEGLSDTFRMISFQDNMIEARIGQLNAMTNYQLALAQMEFVRGNMFERHDIILTADAQELKLEDF
ncbi:MAG: hypothetical protein C0622_11055 [Desulfuromonas sp.]|nr:MAG: hypothetical protein C0622_11055 [Desulfuromonas sp.]